MFDVIKKTIYLILTVLILSSPAFALSEAGEYSLDKPNFLLKDQLTFGNTQIWGAFNNHFMYTLDNKENEYEIDALNIGADSNFGKVNTRVMFNYNPLSDRPLTQQLFADMYIQDRHIPNHVITIGHQRPPVGRNGGESPYTLDSIMRSQIARNFGTVRKLGASIKGERNIVEYNLGLYSSDTYFQEFFPGLEFVGWVDVKKDTKYGSFNAGYGLDAGKRGENFCVNSFAIGYDYKKFSFDAEYGIADNYNGLSGSLTEAKASGYNASVGYMITPKVQVTAGYDEFTKNDVTKRYMGTGLNYYIKGNALKIQSNYFYSPDNGSHRLLLGIQFLL